jgi:hypothetical protein
MFPLRRTYLLAVVFATSFRAWAQTPDDFHWCTLSGGAGYSTVAGKDGSSLSGQWNVQAGAGFSVLHNKKASLFLNFDYLFDETSVKMSALTEARNLNPTNIALLNATGGTSNFNVIAFDPTVRFPISSHAELYVLGGFGWFRRQVDLTGLSSQGSLLQPGNPSVFLRNTSSGAIDAGAGVNFKKKHWAMPYIEIRVVHGLAVNGSTTLVPFAAGIRW